MNFADAKAPDLVRSREMIQLAIGVHQVIFVFDQDVTVSVEGHFTYASGPNVVDWRPGEIFAAAKAVALLGCTVLNAQGIDDGLRLSFSNGDLLTITRESSGFESYQVTAKGVTIVV